ncbi:hypothetical protein M431DRAFT_557419 [Trichoderma harzianum CBS 226.95]|uniref:Uncharacterized protein n=1 Tax=Trichoderma harzianum CBS 226.95 TaxID=983964 RepID=A0A2T4A727_TRIHA|nr:hypothetical protein M431DRAFT_557419 [Trichoderma harzianum CBS 226.95]PTB52857.1 hypothetical protein M431DRAFT_557419 [Trichoderma harzianum CBS 226.95]
MACTSPSKDVLRAIYPSYLGNLPLSLLKSTLELLNSLLLMSFLRPLGTLRPLKPGALYGFTPSKLQRPPKTSSELLMLLGYPGHHQPTITVDVEKFKSVIQGLPGTNPDDRGYFDYDRTWLEARDGSVIKEYKQNRSSFKDHVRTTQWDDLQLTYFISYAMCNYLSIPFLFIRPDFTTRELEPHTEGRDNWRVLEVTYPDGFPTHTKVQKFYFDDKDFLLRRMDYVTDVAKGVAAHYCWDHKNIDGLVFPTLRRIVRRNGDVAVFNGPSGFVIDYTNVVIHEKAA